MQKANAAKRMVAELTLVRMCDPRLDTSMESLVARVEKLEDAALTGTLTARPQKAPATAPAPKEEPPKVSAKARDPQEKAPEPKAEPKQPSVPKPQNGGRVLTRMRGFINCIERIRRENAMLASFIGDARAYLDEQQRVVVILPNAFAEMMLEQNGGRDVLRHALCLELAREVHDRELLVETADAPTAKNDTIIDDILSAANDGQ
jgi:DNA polymerase-3 subunit gamma/tau